MSSVAIVAISLSQFLSLAEAPADPTPATALVEFARAHANLTLPASVRVEDLLYDAQTKTWAFVDAAPATQTWRAPAECREEGDINLRRECLRDEDHVLSALEDARADQAGTWADDLLAEADGAVLQARMR